MHNHRESHNIPTTQYKFSKVQNVRKATANFRQTRPVNKISDLVKEEGLFTTKCRYSDKHIRKVVSVMDDNRISQKAYQELKNVCGGHMPDIKSNKGSEVSHVHPTATILSH